MPSPLRPLALLTAALAIAACAKGGEPAKTCATAIWHRPASSAAYVEILGDFNGWKRPGVVPSADRADGWRVAAIDLGEGPFARYAILEDGVWLRDAAVGTSAFYEGREVTLRPVTSCAAPTVTVAAVEDDPAGAVVQLAYTAGSGGAPLDEAITVTDRDGAPAPVTVTPRGGGLSVHVPAALLAGGRPRLWIRGADRDGVPFPEVIATVWPAASRDLQPADVLWYQVVTDRFRGDDGGPLAPPTSAGGRAGGTLRGVQRALEDGTLRRLGVGGLWLSPLYENPEGEFLGAKDGRKYTGYHGYWPKGPRALDRHLGAEGDLRALVDAAHAQGIRVLFDVVPNHVHAESPYAQTAGFTTGTPGACTCGVTCDWATHIQDCWFTDYLPNLDWTNEGLAAAQTADISWWVERFDADGVRIDAVPMMPRAATRRIADALRRRLQHPGNRLYVVGENFTGPTSYGQLAYHLGPQGLDGEFHFPLLWALRSAIASGAGPMKGIDDALAAGEAAWGGSGAVMGITAGNHDVARLATVSNGDSVTEGWTPAPTPTDPLVYAKQRLALGLVLTLPGAPFLYYGDEIALPGREDPDARRVLPGADQWTAAQKSVFERTAALGTLRRCADVLRRGTYRSLYADGERLLFAREIPGSPEETLLVLATRTVTPEGTPGPAQERLDIPLPGIAPGPFRELFLPDGDAGATITVTSSLTTFRAPSWSLRLYAPATSPLLARCPR